MPKHKPAPGYPCPDCGLKMRVVCTRPRAPGIIIRVRECPGCGRMRQTIERPHGEIGAALQK